MRGGGSSVAARATLAVAVLITGTACVGRSDVGSGTATLTVLAAASLNQGFPWIASEYERTHRGVEVRFSFAGTDALVVQIEQGAPGDIFAGASMKYGDQLFREGLVETPHEFATNRLVLVLPPSNPAGIASPRDLAKGGVKVVIGADTVPVGAYTRKVLDNLDALYGRTYSSAVLSNVVSNEDNVEGVLAKVRLGEADAGFVYVTDAAAVGEDVRRVPVPEQAGAIAGYPIAVVKQGRRRALAREFQRFVLSPIGQRLLAQAGFGPPPAR